MYFLVIFLLAIIGLVYLNYPTCSEQFGTAGNCVSCDNLSLAQCTSCIGCGFISKAGTGQCIPGDMYGPFDLSNSSYKNARWFYNDPFWSDFYVSDDIISRSTY